MKTAYLNCLSGISGDMMVGALIDLGLSIDFLSDRLKLLGLPGFAVDATEVKKKGFRAIQFLVTHSEQKVHRHWSEIREMIDASQLNQAERETALKIFQSLAVAEAKVHGSDVDKVHFHEVGAIDSIVDIVSVAIGLNYLQIDQLFSSEVSVGHGDVSIAHGLVSLPAPATAQLLIGKPVRQTNIPKELTTPTGAAIVDALCNQFGPMPSMAIEKIGYGSGTRDLDQQANILRVTVGEMSQSIFSAHEAWSEETIVELETNIDDTSPELIGFCIERLFAAGALDVFSTAISMKKNRPAVKLTVLCQGEQTKAMKEIIFRETTTLGIRHHELTRARLNRTEHRVETEYGEIKGKLCRGRSSPRFFAEYEHCREIAMARGIAIQEVFERAQEAFRKSKSSAIDQKTDTQP